MINGIRQSTAFLQGRLVLFACVQGIPWWRHQMETFSALLAICAGNSPVPGEFPGQRPVTQSFDVFFDLRLNNGWVNNREAGDLRRCRAHYDVIVMLQKMHIILLCFYWIWLYMMMSDLQFFLEYVYMYIYVYMYVAFCLFLKSFICWHILGLYNKPITQIPQGYRKNPTMHHFVTEICTFLL